MMRMNIIFYKTHPSVRNPKRELGRVMHMIYGYRSSDPFFDTFVSSLTCPGERKYFSTTGSKNSQQRNHVIDNIQNSLRNLQSFVPQTQNLTLLQNVKINDLDNFKEFVNSRLKNLILDDEAKNILKDFDRLLNNLIKNICLIREVVSEDEIDEIRERVRYLFRFFGLSNDFINNIFCLQQPQIGFRCCST